MGRQIGEAAAPTIRRMQENYRQLLRSSRERLKLRWEGAVLQARKYHPYAAEGARPYLEELEGIAEGAGLSLDDLMVLNCIEGIAGDALHLKCTSFAVSAELTAEGHVLVGHNEDWWPEDQDTVYLVHATPENEPAYLAFTYGGLLPNIGFNAAGIAQCCDSVYPNDTRVGVPRIFVARSVLGASRISEALERAVPPKRAAGYNHLIAERSGELYNLEASAKRFALRYGTAGAIVHTNHYLDPEMQRRTRRACSPPECAITAPSGCWPRSGRTVRRPSRPSWPITSTIPGAFAATAANRTLHWIGPRPSPRS
jgi:isopenicillin-N N-acyltransferase-like protein